MERIVYNLRDETIYLVEKLRYKFENEELNVSIDVDPISNSIVIKGDDENLVDSIYETIRALDFGFPPKHAFLLLNEEGYRLEIFDLKNVIVGVRDKKKEIKKICSLLIGKEGKSKKTLENICNVKILIDDKKGIVYAIGKDEDMSIFKLALSLFLRGLKHGKVWETLEKVRRKERLRKLMLDYSNI